MKMGVKHRIPSDQSLTIFRKLAESSNCNPDEYVFAGQKMGRPLLQMWMTMTMTMMLRRMKLGHYTVRGMRSCFRDIWVT